MCFCAWKMRIQFIPNKIDVAQTQAPLNNM